MRTTNDILTLLERTISTISPRILELILRKSRETEVVLNLLADEASRYIYAQELIYCALAQVLQPDLAVYYSGLMTNNEFQQYVANFRSHELFAKFKGPDVPNAKEIMAIDLTATFVLEQYSYHDIVKVEQGDICLDCGAFIGDTALYFLQKGASRVYAFEIDKRNLPCLRENIANFSGGEKVSVIEEAVSDGTGTMKYLPMQGNVSGGRITSGQGEYEIKATSIDIFCEENNVIPNFIKMDIEGAELNALIGGQKIISEHLPKLAVCIYHELSHRWSIPLILHEIAPNYKLYLKKSQPYGETVLFAMP